MSVKGSSRGYGAQQYDSSLLERVARTVGSTFEREDLLQALFGDLNDFVRIDSLALYWRLPNGNFLLTVVAPASPGVICHQVGVSLGNDVPEEKSQPFLCADNRASSHPVLRWLAGCGVASSVCVPIVVAQQLVGWLAAGRVGQGSFSPADVRPLVQVAQLLGPVVNSFHLYERLEAAHKELAAARDELTRSERLVVQGELASGVAHDINNILGLISARADLLKAQVVSPQAEASVEAIRRAVDDGITVVRRMTQFTRMQRNQDLVGLDVNRLVEDVLEMTRPRWQHTSSQGRAIQVSFKAGPTSTVMGVPSELREVMVNLIMNAVDAMPSGGAIEIETGQEGAWASVSVKDTGCGISEDVRQHIFDPFFTTKGESGSGLGLWVSQGIVSRHGGDIQVQSTPGKGSTFRVRLPLAQSIPAVQVARKASRQRHSILVVDDEVGLGEALKLSLEMVGYQVVFSPSPAEALALFENGDFDLVITDLRMPGMTGWEMAARMKRIRPKTPIIAMTGWPVDLMRDGQKCSDMEAIIQKPYRVNDLRARIARLLDDKRREG